MREETRKKLERVLFLRRVRWAAAGTCVAMALAGALFLEDLDASEDRRSVHAVVANVGPLYGSSAKAAKDGLSVDLKLDDGRLVNVHVLKKTGPHVGDDVQIAEHRHGTGRVTYSWK